MLLKGIDEKPDSPDDTFFLCYIFFLYLRCCTHCTQVSDSLRRLLYYTLAHTLWWSSSTPSRFSSFFFRCRLAWPHRNIWGQNVILLLFKSNNYEHGHKRSARDRKDGRWSGKKKQRNKETLLKKRERTGQIISQQELKEETRQNGQNLIVSIFFFFFFV